VRHVVVVGGGIAGLALAHRLVVRGARDRGLSVTVLEGASRPGGPIRSEETEGFLLEHGPHGMLDDAPETRALVEALGLEGRRLASRDEARRRYVFRGGRLHALPGGPLAFLRSGLLSPAGKLRILREPWARPRPEEEETIEAFATRRLGPEAAAALVGPMVTGVFAGDPRQLSLRACFPRLFDLEREHGGLVRGLVAGVRRRRAEGGPPRSPLGRLTSFRGGIEELVRALAGSLGPRLRTGAFVKGLDRLPVERGSPRYRLVLEDGSAVAADVVVLAASAGDAGRLLEPLDPPAAELLLQVPTAPLGVVGLGYAEPSLPRPLDGFGFLVARGEGPRILGALWESSVFDERAPLGSVLLRVMVGGAADPEALALPDERLVASVREDLRTTMALHAAPTFVRVVRHRFGMPQYTVGHLARLERVERRLADACPGVLLAGSSYRGVAVNACIADASHLAQRILAEAAPPAAGLSAPAEATA
jgi:protoporphyrinogen/coproporphyrinogen III oxidase